MPKLLSRAAALITRSSECTDTLPWALQDISFELKRGENPGIIERNGAGKSTLLTILAGLSPAPRRETAVRGRCFTMIEVPVGTNTAFTGRAHINTRSTAGRDKRWT